MFIDKFLLLRASLEKLSGNVITEETFPFKRESLAVSESLRRVTLKGRLLEIPLMAFVETNGNGPMSSLTIPSSKDDKIRAGSEGAVRLNIEKTNMITVGTIMAGLNNSLLRKSEYEEGIKLNLK